MFEASENFVGLSCSFEGIGNETISKTEDYNTQIITDDKIESKKTQIKVGGNLFFPLVFKFAPTNNLKFLC